jgi:hypothetical protein
MQIRVRDETGDGEVTFRVRPLSNMLEFQNAFSGKDGSAMVRPEAERCKFWTASYPDFGRHLLVITGAHHSWTPFGQMPIQARVIFSVVTLAAGNV